MTSLARYMILVLNLTIVMKAAYANIPGTSANLGPGYDCLGIALDLHNRVVVKPAEQAATPHPMADAAIQSFFTSAGIEPQAVSWKMSGDVPASRGLGSSVTLRLGLLMALNEAFAHPLPPQSIYTACCALEGHPDNAAPAQFGGFVSALPDTHFVRFEVDQRLEFILLIPDHKIETEDARQVLPDMVPRRDALINTANAALMTAAFASQDYELLRYTFTDTLHQPFRLPLLPQLNDVISAGVEAGALGGYLSGSGSTICCVTLGNSKAIADAMQVAMPGHQCRTEITTACNHCASSGLLSDSGILTATD